MNNMFIFFTVFEPETHTPSFFKGSVTQKGKERRRAGSSSSFFWGVLYIVAPTHMQNSDMERWRLLELKE